MTLSRGFVAFFEFAALFLSSQAGSTREKTGFLLHKTGFEGVSNFYKTSLCDTTTLPNFAEASVTN